MAEGLFQNKYRIKPTRIPNWNYGFDGYYFITICTENKTCYFGDVIDSEMRLSEVGEMAKKFWLEISKHFPFVKLDYFVVMPNHIHGILIIDKYYKI